MRHTAIGIIIGVLILAILLLILPIQVIFDVPVEAKVFPSKTWKLIQEGEQFRTQERVLSGTSSSLQRNFVFERGDVIDISLDSALVSGQYVHQDQALVKFRSMMHTLRIQRALNEIEVQQSLRVAGEAPLKWPLSKEAQDKVMLAESNLKLQHANHDRLKTLFDEGVISKAELDAQTNRLEVADQELRIARQQLTNTTFQQRPEDLAVIDQRIATMDRELDVLLAQQASYSVNAPMQGLVKVNPELGVVLSIEDTSSYAVMFAFPASDKKYLTDQSVIAFDKDEDITYKGVHLTSEMGLNRGRQNYLGTATVDAKDFETGAVMTAKIVCDTIPLREYLKRKLF